MKKLSLILWVVVFLSSCSNTKVFISQKKGSKQNYWQQHVDYTMHIDVDVENFQYKGKQELVYTNNSPDELTRVYYHLYFNAFQPNSQMDIRSRQILDPDRRVGDRISKLSSKETGYIKVVSLKQDGVDVQFEVVGTVLEVTLNTPIQSETSTTFDMVYDAQIPKQIRRSGRNNKEGVALSMAQWYPKLAEYDFQGWHTSPYIAREFHGVWGNFNVTIHIDKNYTVGGSGNLKNPQQVGHGYEDVSKKLNVPEGDKLTWNFEAPNVHDFMWAADPNYVHDLVRSDQGIDLHFFYKKNLEEGYLKNWKDLQPKTVELLEYFSSTIGQYPYKQYSVVQGGDGGMEYAMATLITGQRNFKSLFGVTAHEMAHTWFQFLLATNESLHPWMDEGFTTYISNKAEKALFEQGSNSNPHENAYKSYRTIVERGYEEPQSTHSDRYQTNWAYGTASYSKGAIFLSQLEYIIGKENTALGLKKYFEDFSFKHPTPNDIKRTMEKVSEIHLGWYLNEWTQTTHTIDYAVKSIDEKTIVIERIGQMPMPIDLEVEYKDGSRETFYIPLEMMRGNKPTSSTILDDWGWANPLYKFKAKKELKLVEIDPSQLMADVNLENNRKRSE